MPRRLFSLLLSSILLAGLLGPEPAAAQMGGMGGMGGGMGGPGGGGAPPPANEKPKFRDHVMQQGGLKARRERGDEIVLGVEIVGNRVIDSARIIQLLQTRKDRVFDEDTVLSDVRRLYEYKAFSQVTHRIERREEGVWVRFEVVERPMITAVVFHGNRGINDRPLRGRAGISKDDPLNEYAIESARRRLVDYYLEEGFNQVVIEAIIGTPDDPGAVIFRINEGPKERIAAIHFHGNTIERAARLKKVIGSRGPAAGVLNAFNVADLKQIEEDVETLTHYYRTLGYLRAEVGRQIEYDQSGKRMTVTFVVDEGPRFTVTDVRIEGNRFIDEASLRDLLKLTAGSPFHGTKMRQDVRELTNAYGGLGFIYADVQSQLIWNSHDGSDDIQSVDVVYRIKEGDRWKVGNIYIDIDGEPNLMREHTLLNLTDLVEGELIDRRLMEMNRRRLMHSQLLETNPTIADPPDLRVVPRDGERVDDPY